MKARTRVLLDLAIEQGVRYGWSRAHKYVENPSEDVIKETIEDAVMAQIYDYFKFDDEEL